MKSHASRLTNRFAASLAALRGVGASPDLRRIQLAYVGSEVGGWIAMIGLSVVSYADAGLTGFGIVFGLRMLPPAIAAPFMGLLGDRFPRRRVMLAADLTRAALTGLAAAVVLIDGPLLVVYATVSAISVASTAFRPAQAALLPALARTPDELTACNAVSSTIESVTSFAGPALGGLLVAVTEPGVAFAATAALFLWSAFLVSGIREPVRETTGDNSIGDTAGVRAQLAAGARTIVSDRRVGLLIFLIGAQVAVSGALFVLLSGLAFDRLGTGEDGYGVLLSALGIGGLLGALVSFGLAGTSLARSFAAGVALWGAPIALLAVWQTESGAFALVTVVGLANTLVDVAAFTLLQRAVPDDVLARVFGILESIMYGTTVAGALTAPLLVSLLDLNAALVITGLFLPVLVMLTWPALRSLDLAASPATDRLELLRSVPFLALLPGLTLEHLARTVEEVAVAAGETVVTQAEVGDRFYVVESGRVGVSVDGTDAREEGPGAYFGEIALLRDTPRTATVTALTDCVLLLLGRDEFVSAVSGHVESADAADAVVAGRLGAYRPALLQL